MDRSPPFLVAAVGASAGGMVAFASLLRNIPADTRIALLLVQHLAPQQPSILPEILENATRMPVVTGQDQLRLEPGHVYVIPPNTVMTVEDGMMRVRVRTEGRYAHGDGPVDALFRSLANEYGQRALGIVLSGAGSDGANGVREIKEAGGITFAQAPEEADIDGMPRSAAATGSVDAVLTAMGIAEQLVRLAEHPFFRHEAAEIDPELELPSASGQRRRIFQLLRRATGVEFNNYKTPTITRRIQRRMALHRMSLLSEYVAFLERDPQELQRLQADLLIHVTSFFREPESFAALADHVLPGLLRDHSDAPFRAWVPGCSTGEETYSLVMLLLEFLGERSEQIPLQIFSTDISESTIDQARAGTYPASIAAQVSPERLRRFFAPFDGGYRISKAVRDCCVFARQDVTRDPPFSKLDLILCRNLLIYLTQPTQRKVMGVFQYALNPDGVLMLGRSETAGSNNDLFSVIDKRFQLYARKPGRVRMEIDFAPIRTEAHATMHREKLPRAIRASAKDWDVQTDANRFLIDHYAPPAVILDRDLKIVRSRGSTSRFVELPSGEVTLDLLKMVRPQLLFGARAVVQEALTTGRPAARTDLSFKTESGAGRVDLHAVPLGTGEARQIMLLFEEPRGLVKGRPARAPAKNVAGSPKHLVTELQDELVETRQQLQAIIDDLAATNEELQSANEEVLSSNEELQSTNEELDTAKEELQSTNEELSTLNDELHGRNEELSRVNSDLVNLLASVQIPIVMVSQDLKIRRFTPAAEKTLNIIPSDVGRPIGHLKPNLSCPELEGLITEVIDSVTIYDGEAESDDGRLFALQIRPYKSVENRIDGAVLALFDVSAARQQEVALVAARQTEDAILSITKEPMLLLDSGGRVGKANDAFFARFQLTPAEISGHLLHELDRGAWNIPALRAAVDDALAKKNGFDDVLVEHDFPRSGRRRMLAAGRRVELGRRGSASLMIVLRDAA